MQQLREYEKTVQDLTEEKVDFCVVLTYVRSM